MGKEQLELFWEIFLLLTPPAATPVYTERKGGDWMSKNPLKNLIKIVSFIKILLQTFTKNRFSWISKFD